ncbi:unnamed protein product [Strongylus vulgaris]|uniref:Uncharacterized protein n=1 Tax=Strongylus vulgaris TaxID=40348 RepID=A0A3P7IF71_STRVU|nr:unnamed protein product [Strongylus vulgaris]
MDGGFISNNSLPRMSLKYKNICYTPIWDFATLVHVRDFKGHRAPITALCFQLKTNCVFSASRDRSVKLWDLDQMGMVDTMYGHQDAVVALSALQKQRVITAGRQDRSCRLWKVEDESQLLFNGYSACVSMDCAAMLNDEHFVSGSADGYVILSSKSVLNNVEFNTIPSLGHGFYCYCSYIFLCLKPFSALL